MGRPKPLGMVLGLAGNVMTGVALYHLIQTGSCGGPGVPPCPSELTPHFIMLPVGITLSVISTFLGGALFAFAGIFLSIGIGSLAAGFGGDGEDTRTFAFVFGGIFTAVALLPLVGGAILRPMARAKVRSAERLIAEGTQGVGTVVEVRDTGVTINENPRVEITMRVEPADGSPAFDACKTVVVSRVAVPRAGDRFPVWYDRADPTTWAYGTDVQADATPEVRALFAAAQDTPAQPAPGDLTWNAPAPASDPLSEIARLNELRMKGAVTDEEFQVAKDRLLAELGGGSVA